MSRSPTRCMLYIPKSGRATIGPSPTQHCHITAEAPSQGLVCNCPSVPKGVAAAYPLGCTVRGLSRGQRVSFCPKAKALTPGLSTDVHRPTSRSGELGALASTPAVSPSHVCATLDGEEIEDPGISTKIPNMQVEAKAQSTSPVVACVGVGRVSREGMMSVKARSDRASVADLVGVLPMLLPGANQQSVVSLPLDAGPMSSTVPRHSSCREGAKVDHIGALASGTPTPVMSGIPGIPLEGVSAPRIAGYPATYEFPSRSVLARSESLAARDATESPVSQMHTTNSNLRVVPPASYASSPCFERQCSLDAAQSGPAHSMSGEPAMKLLMPPCVSSPRPVQASDVSIDTTLVATQLLPSSEEHV